MAFQFRRLLSPSSFFQRHSCFSPREPVMPQYGALRYSPCNCIPKSARGNGERHGKFVQLKIRRTGENCSTPMVHFKKNQLKVGQDDLHTYAQLVLASRTSRKPWNIAFSRSFQADGIVKWYPLSEEIMHCRLLSYEGSQKIQVLGAPMRRISSVVRRYRDCQETGSFETGSIDGGLQEAFSDPAVKRGVPVSSKLGIKFSNTSKPKQQDQPESMTKSGNHGQPGKINLKFRASGSTGANSKSNTSKAKGQDHRESKLEGGSLGQSSKKKKNSGAAHPTSASSKSSNTSKPKKQDHPHSKIEGTNIGTSTKKTVKSRAAVSITTPSIAPEKKGCTKTGQVKTCAGQKGSATETDQASQSLAKEATMKNQKSKTMPGKSAGKRNQQREALVPTKSDKASLQESKSAGELRHSAENIRHWSLEHKANHQKGGFKPLFPPSGKSVVVVESVTKAKVIQKYLGDMYEVLASHGHVRDLAARSGSVRPEDDFSMVWEVPSSAWTHLKSIKVALNGANNLILASDPDREGEAIAWHIAEMLCQQDALHANLKVVRVVFHEITESSIKNALQSPRDISVNLVHAYLARRALDYLIGFNISPLLWRKLPGCQSAGRVQSAALAIICDREAEIDEFKTQEYWSVDGKFHKLESSIGKSISLSAHVTHFDFNKLERLSISSLVEAEAIVQKVMSSKFEVVGLKRSEMQKNSPQPYITSSLQQDAANKLKFYASQTMKIAQKLYEGVKLSDREATGLITYLRTDGLHVSKEAAEDIHSLIIERYGQDFAFKRTYFKKVKNAQEAHEAIRPTDIRRLPSMLVDVLDEDSLQLYTLIWSRTMACQMSPAKISKIQVDIGNADGSIVLRSTASKIVFPGYQAVYKDEEAKTSEHDEEEGNAKDEAFEILNKLKAGDAIHVSEMEPKQHFISPPPRYSEGALVKKLEELGIGRPSTYATIMTVLQGRNYVTIRNRQLIPEFRGRMVSAFLSHFFSDVTDYSFTADMENELDNVSSGITEWKGLLKDYWARFSKYCERVSGVDVRAVEKMLEEAFQDILFSSLKSRTCPSCGAGTLVFKVSRFGAGYFIGCDQHPRCKYIAKTLYSEDDETPTEEKPNASFEPKLIGVHPNANEKIFLKNGPYGFYIQLGDDAKGHLPKRASAARIKDPESMSLEDALELLRYPITLGKHPEDKQPIILRISKFGFAVKHRRTLAPVPKSINPQDVTLEMAMKYLSGKNAKQSGRPKKQVKLEEAMEAM